MLTFGIEQLSKKEGYLFYRLADKEKDQLVDHLDLYETDDAALEALLEQAVLSAKEALIDAGRARDVMGRLYQTENISGWMQALLQKAIEKHW
ncbi:MAG: hypothetical protein HZB62_07455 [Nitrospirae bacterium]|nr:hypothetical protein [Nitrospirota bacterium]